MIGFYDSGIGGFSVLNEVIKENPKLKFQYLADTKILPLGQKSPQFINKRVKKAVSFLFGEGCNLIILACNTASVNSIRDLQQNWLFKNFPNKQVLSVTKPLIELLEARHLNQKKGLLLATVATISRNFYQQELQKIDYQKTDFLACPNLATAIENRDSNIEKVLKNELISVQDLNKIEFVILACTHYPFIRKEIDAFFKNKVEVIDPSDEVAKKLHLYLTKHPEYEIQESNFDSFKNKLFTTGNLKDFKAKVDHFLDPKFLEKKELYELKKVEII
jgi:glutamate racemase